MRFRYIHKGISPASYLYFSGYVERSSKSVKYSEFRPQQFVYIQSKHLLYCSKESDQSKCSCSLMSFWSPYMNMEISLVQFSFVSLVKARNSASSASLQELNHVHIISTLLLEMIMAPSLPPSLWPHAGFGKQSSDLPQSTH